MYYRYYYAPTITIIIIIIIIIIVIIVNQLVFIQVVCSLVHSILPNMR